MRSLISSWGVLGSLKGMERGVWLLAAWLVQRHGLAAPFAVDRKIAALAQEHANELHIGVWRQIAQAVLEITKVTPGLTERVR
jgi:hypothetical protein